MEPHLSYLDGSFLEERLDHLTSTMSPEICGTAGFSVCSTVRFCTRTCGMNFTTPVIDSFTYDTCLDIRS